MTWTDDLARVTLPDGRTVIGASFRGVTFFVDSSDRSGGRRLAAHEFMGNDFPAFDDLGRSIIGYRVTAYVVGDDYVASRDALLSALEDSSGPGELIHPYYGRKRVRSGVVSVRESIADGGMATFQIPFFEDPDAIAPAVSRDLAAMVRSSAASALADSQSEFESSYDVSGQPAFSTLSLREDLTALSDGMLEKLAPIIETTQELSLLSVDVDIISSQVATLIRTPADVIDALLDAALQLKESIEKSPRKVAEALLDTYAIPPVTAVLGDSATRDQERINQVALADGLRRALVINAAILIPDVDFDTIEEATALRDQAIDALDALADTAGSSYPSLVLLRAALTQAVPGDAQLARVRTINTKVPLPSVLLSYQLFGSQDQEADIIARNGVQHPGFIYGDIKVLTDG